MKYAKIESKHPPVFLTLKDKRISLSKLFVFFALFFSIVGIFIVDIPLIEGVTLSIMFLLLALSNFYGFYALKNDKPVLLIFLLFCLYVWIAFPIKLILTVYDPMTTWLSYSFFSPDTVKKNLPGAFINIFPGLLLLFAGFYVLHRRIRHIDKYNSMQINHVFFITIIIGLMALRLFNQLELNIGLPGVKPNVISIPLLTGVLELLSRSVLMALVNLYLYYVLRLSDKKGIWIALLLAIINIILGLRVGYKSELIFQSLLFIYYFFEVSPYLSKANRKFVLLFTLVLLISTIVIYPLVNNYRDYLLSGKNFSAAIDSAQAKAKKQNSSFALDFLNRINGIDAFYAATKLGQGREFGLDSLFNDNVMDLIKEKLYGAEKDNAVTAFGTTQFSVFYLVGGVGFLSLGSFIVGWVIRWSSNFLRQKVFRLSFTFQAYLPLFCILWVKLLSSGGDIELYIKELFLVILCLAFMERYGTRNWKLKERQA